MPLAQGILNRLDKALNKFGPRRLVYKRVTTRTGGDDLIGTLGTQTVVTTLLSPQPLITRPALEQIGSRRRPAIFETSGFREVAPEYLIFVSANAISVADLQNDALVFVFIDTDGSEETFEVFDFDFTQLQGQDIAYTVGLKSVKR